MSEREYAPLSIACVRALIDKQSDKRKAAALEIEKMVKEFVAVNNTVQIRKLLKVLGTEFTMSQNQNYKRGGLLGLAGVAIALGKDSAEYTEAIIRPILTNFTDSEGRMRYSACEALFNVVKVARGAVLPYFADIFTGLSRLAADNDSLVKSASEHLDRLMKDIVTENATFDLVGFMPLLRERLYSKNTFARQHIISWVAVLYAVPDIQLIIFLPEILDGLFVMLPDASVKLMCQNVLSEFLRTINKDPSQVDFSKMINILITHSQNSDETLQMTSLTWINDFLRLSGENMLPHTSGVLTAILPCLAYESDSKKSIKELAKSVNSSLMELIVPSLDEDNQEKENTLDLPSIVSVLEKQLGHFSVNTRVASLKWIHHLHSRVPQKMLGQVDSLFPSLLNSLSDNADEVVQQALTVLAQIISPDAPAAPSTPQKMSPYFDKFLVSLLKLFREDRQLLEERGSFIIRQLCTLLSAEDVYKNAAEIITSEKDLKFARVMIDTLNTILFTSSELYHLRTILKNEPSSELFESLYPSWCHNSVATISLCLLTHNYQHVCDIIMILAGYEVTVEFLAEIDRLIQLIESPIFMYLRLELIQFPQNYYLIRSMYSLLMLIPQSETFHLLRQRLECIPKVQELVNGDRTTSKGNKYASIDFEGLRKHFVSIQELHKTRI